MRHAAFVILTLLLVSLSVGLAVADVFVISDFETAGDLSQWEPTGWPTSATLTRVAGHATSGSYSCHMGLPYPADYPGMNLTSFPITDWSAYDVLRIDFDNPNGFAMVLHVEISDSVQGSTWPKRYYTEKTLIPGLNYIEIDLHNLPRNDGTGDVDTANINRFLYYVTGFSSATDMYCDYVRLETVQDDPWADTVRDIYKFDFGTADSPRWPDFFRVTTADMYPVAGGWWGWTDSPYRYSGDLGGPDDLCRDYVRPLPCCPTGDPLDFRIDVPNGNYTVYMIARSGNLSGMPVLGWEIWAEGVAKVNVPMDSATFYTTDYYYRGMMEDYPPSQPFFDQFVDANYPAYKFTTTVSDGALNLSVYRAWMFMLIVYPTSLEAEMGPRLADWETARQMQFESAFYVNPPDDLTFTPTSGEIARGYAAWPVATMDPCYPDTLPPSPRPPIALASSACQGEARALGLAIRPLGNLAEMWVEVTDLSNGLGDTIPSSQVELQHVRYLATPDTEFFGSGVLTWKPRLLQGNFPVSVASQVTKEIWLTVHVPVGTPAGTYAGTATIHTPSPQLAVPITVQVWPFALDEAHEMAFGWYYMSPDARYCFDRFADMAGAGDAMLRLDFADMKEHGFNALQFPSPGVSADGSGNITWFDTTQLDRYLAAMNDVGFGGLWLGQTGTIDIANRLIGQGLTEFSPTFNTAYKNALGMIVDWSTVNDAPLAMYLVDEPRESMIQPWNRNFADTMEYCDLAHQVPGATTTVTVMRDEEEGVDYVPLADAMDIMQTHPWPNSAGLIARALELGKPNWFYNTGGDLRLVYGFYNYKFGDGTWQWHYDWLDGDIFDAFPYSPFNNHWRYTYPSPDGPVPTLRHEWASQGITDYRYAATLDRLSAEARASGCPFLVHWADQADALLQSIIDDTPDYPTGAGENFASIPDGPTYLSDLEQALDSYRVQVGALIEAYASLTAEPSVLLEVHPNERAQGPGGAARLGTAPWHPSGLGPGGWYEWKRYEFDGSPNLWIQVCAQCFNSSQNAVGESDKLQMKVDGQIPNDHWGIMSGVPGAYQWDGTADNGNRLTLEFLVTGLTPGPHTLQFSADETPIIWWVKVSDLGATEQ